MNQDLSSEFLECAIRSSRKVDELREISVIERFKEGVMDENCSSRELGRKKKKVKKEKRSEESERK